jgi:hypothetical protein
MANLTYNGVPYSVERGRDGRWRWILLISVHSPQLREQILRDVPGWDDTEDGAMAHAQRAIDMVIGFTYPT